MACAIAFSTCRADNDCGIYRDDEREERGVEERASANGLIGELKVSRNDENGASRCARRIVIVVLFRMVAPKIYFDDGSCPYRLFECGVGMGFEPCLYVL